MSESKHTPGPWERMKFINHELQTEFAMVKVGERAHMIGYSEEDFANAQLIAAAPELLEVLIKVAATLAWNAHGECRAIHDGPIMPSSSAIELARDAIAKATGASQ